jgi:hypothetical protein
LCLADVSSEDSAAGPSRDAAIAALANEVIGGDAEAATMNDRVAVPARTTSRA